jgi:hypothetical protein
MDAMVLTAGTSFTLGIPNSATAEGFSSSVDAVFETAFKDL